jgi:glucose-1-phosphate adenylyltransferase
MDFTGSLRVKRVILKCPVFRLKGGIKMLKDYMGIILLNEDEDNIRRLTKNRPLASIPFGGRYRIIDFVLSNLVNSGMTNIGIFTDGKTRSLMDHLGSGKPWDLDRKINGLFIFNFGYSGKYINEIETLKNNIEYLYKSKESYAIVCSSYMVCNIDYKVAAAYHEKSMADVTIIYKSISNGKTNFINCDVLNLEDDKVLTVGNNIGTDDINNISMEMFIMKKEVLINLVLQCIKTGHYNSIKEAIYKRLGNLNLNAYKFDGYLSCINTIKSYYKTNMDLLDLRISSELFSENGTIFTKPQDEPPTKYTEGSKTENSLVANGCIIEGTVKNSIIFRKVKIHKDAEIKNCIIMQNCEIRSGAKLANIVIDKSVVIEEGKELKGDMEIPLVVERRVK